MTIITTQNGLRALQQGDWTDPSAPIFVFIHGMGGSLHNFARLQYLVSEHSPTVSIELPGHGKSSDPVAPWSVDGIVSAVQASLLELLGKRPVILVGHSLGVLLAARLASRKTLNIQELVGISGALLTIGAMLHHPVRGFFAHPIRTILLKYAVFTASTYPSEAFCDRLNSDAQFQRVLTPFLNAKLTAKTSQVGDAFREQGGKGARRLLKLAKDVDVRELLMNVTTPLSFIVGSKDPLTPASDVRAAAELFGETNVHVIVGSAHWPQVEAGEDVAAMSPFAKSANVRAAGASER